MLRPACSLLLALSASALAADPDPTRVLPPGKAPADARVGKVRKLEDKDFFLKPPATKEAWQKRRQAVREQVLVATGLWPMPPKAPLKPVIHGKVDRGDYTVEKVFFASLPGHYVSGNLYRPKGKTGKLPAVLFAHGHWADGRLYEAPPKEADHQLKVKGEKSKEAARYPFQALPAQLARMGCVVFTYDMVGVADSKPIGHAAGFTDANALLRLQSAMGLQTWNAVRALDFLTGLPDVDPKRVGVTGASGGGTQTFILGAIDDRPAVAFPAVMVSTRMQGGCVCENAPYLRLGTGNVEFAALFAPKPLGMTGADDWTIAIEKEGLPELKAVYKLYGAADKVTAKCFPEFKHNYNQVSREVMYDWFNTHLRLGQTTPVAEKPFKPIAPKELSVYDAEHPRPKDSAPADRLQQYWTDVSDKQMAALQPKDAKGLAEYRRVVGTALRVMLHDEMPAKGGVEGKPVGDATKHAGATWQGYLIGRTGAGEQVPAVVVRGAKFDGTAVVWVHPDGKASLLKGGKVAPAARQALDAGAVVVAVDVLGTGELSAAMPAVDKRYAGYTFGYNRPLLAQRVHDVLTAVAFAQGQKGVKKVHLIGFEKAGPWALLARAACGTAVARAAADVDGFRFDKVRAAGHEMMLPGGLKYGGLGGLTALAAPGELFAHHVRGSGVGGALKAAYAAAGADDKLKTSGEKVAPEKAVEWLLR